MTFSLAQNAIALLIDLAERGEIDPWDVQVIEVIDRFLSKLELPEVKDIETHETGRAPYEADLSESGQAFLYASMLLLLKADSLARLEANDAEAMPDPEELLESEIGADRPLFRNLEQQIRRRATAPPVQRRQVSLQELIAQLNLIATAIADPKPRRANARRPRPQSRSQAMRTITQLAHEENLSEIAAVLEEFLADHWQQFNDEEEWLDFETLLQFWSSAQGEAVPAARHFSQAEATSVSLTAPTIHDRVGVFWALLFLSAQSKVELAQEEFYQDLKVRGCLPADNPTIPTIPPIP